MTPQQIREAISASSQLQSLAVARNDAAIAAILSFNRTKLSNKYVSIRGILESYPGGPIAADALLSKLEAFAAAGETLSSVVKRALVFLNQVDGIDLGSPATLLMLGALADGEVITTAEKDNLITIITVPDPVSLNEVSQALNGVE